MKRTKGKGVSKKKPSSKTKVEPAEREVENPKLFDFGGIPERKLKKNLGC